MDESDSSEPEILQVISPTQEAMLDQILEDINIDEIVENEAYEMAKMISPTRSNENLTDNAYEIDSILAYNETILNGFPSKVFF